MAQSLSPRAVEARLAQAGCVAADEEAQELIHAADGDQALLQSFVARRCEGEPLAWIVGAVRFCGLDLGMSPGVYVPRWQSEPLALRAAELLPDDGVALDVCTGSGAIAAVLKHARPRARIVATDVDPVAVACARRNGVEAYQGDLMATVPQELEGVVNVVTGVVPYVPTGAFHLLARDVRDFEPRLALDGGVTGTDVLVRVARAARRWLRGGGALLLELGGEQGRDLAPVLDGLGYVAVTVTMDGDGDVRAVEAHVPLGE